MLMRVLNSGKLLLVWSVLDSCVSAADDRLCLLVLAWAVLTTWGGKRLFVCTTVLSSLVRLLDCVGAGLGCECAAEELSRQVHALMLLGYLRHVCFDTFWCGA